MPFVRVSLKSVISKPYDFEPNSLGEHLKKKRLQIGLFQKDVADLIGVCEATILHWEKSTTEPPIAFLPPILEFLGYDPFPLPMTLSQHLIATRRENGWSIKEAAVAVGVDPSTWGNWERGGTILLRKHRAAIAELLDVSLNTLDKQMVARWGRLHKQAQF